MKKAPSRPVDRIANAGIFSAFFLWTLVIVPCSYVIALLFFLQTPGMQSAMRQLIWVYGRVTLWLISPWVPVTIRNENLARRLGPGIIVANHQSFLDIYLLGAQNQADICLVSKAWPYRLLFFFAPAMRVAGYLNTEAMTPEDLEALCKKRLKEGTTIVMFPEGSRSRDGKLGRFYSGAFRIAVETGAPVYPLLIRNSFQVFGPGCSYFTPAPISMTFLDAARPEDFQKATLPHRAMLRHVRQQFVNNLQHSAQGR